MVVWPVERSDVLEHGVVVGLGSLKVTGSMLCQREIGQWTPDSLANGVVGGFETFVGELVEIDGLRESVLCVVVLVLAIEAETFMVEALSTVESHLRRYLLSGILLEPMNVASGDEWHSR